MNPLRVAAATLNQTPLDWERNKAHIVEAVEQAREARADILCLPELCITGYGCEDAFLSGHLLETAQQVLLEIVPHTRSLVVCLGLPVLVEGGRFNAACLIADGRILGLVGKQHLANDGIHYEPRWFRPWPAGRTTEIPIGAEPYPCGDLLFEVGGVRIGFEICEDAWVADRPGCRLAQCDVDLILGPSASHFAFRKHDVRRQLVLDGSRRFACGYAFANLLGNEAGRAIYDGQTLIAECGRLLAAGERLSLADVRLITATLDVEKIRTQRTAARQDEATDSAATSGGAADRDDQVRNHTAGADLATTVASPDTTTPLPTRIVGDFAFPDAGESSGRLARSGDVSSAAEAPTAPAWESSATFKEEEFTRAVALGLFDYLRKSRSHGFVVSLSGGADSSAVATLVAVMVHLAAGELGVEATRDKLSHIENLLARPTSPDRVTDPQVELEQTTRRMVGRLLTCVYQSTRNSSETTRRASRQLSAALGARFIELDVDELVQGYVARVAEAIGHDLQWERDDLALQNIQARARAPGVWLLANLRGALLLSTSNRSEAAVGYATMDGDTSGGLAPIAGIDKAFLLRWLQWMEKIGPVGIGPLPALSAVNALPPTAELRPPSARQTDEDDLMPYQVLDAIERAAIRDKLPPLAVWRTVLPEFSQYDPATLGGWVERFFRLWCRNQWKRERYAPSFHLDDENLDPKTWCRFPILSGGFERELAELRKEIASLTEHAATP